MCASTCRCKNLSQKIEVLQTGRCISVWFRSKRYVHCDAKRIRNRQLSGGHGAVLFQPGRLCACVHEVIFLKENQTLFVCLIYCLFLCTIRQWLAQCANPTYTEIIFKMFVEPMRVRMQEFCDPMKHIRNGICHVLVLTLILLITYCFSLPSLHQSFSNTPTVWFIEWSWHPGTVRSASNHCRQPVNGFTRMPSPRRCPTLRRLSVPPVAPSTSGNSASSVSWRRSARSLRLTSSPTSFITSPPIWWSTSAALFVSTTRTHPSAGKMSTFLQRTLSPRGLKVRVWCRGSFPFLVPMSELALFLSETSSKHCKNCQF